MSFLLLIVYGLSRPSALGPTDEPVKPSLHRLTPPQAHEVSSELSFERNDGQTSEQVRFVSRGTGYQLFLTSDQAILLVQQANSKAPAQKSRLWTPARVGLKLIGAKRAPEITGVGELSGKSNYFIGKDPRRWRTNVPTYARVRYEAIYPGVDLVYYGKRAQLEFDFVIAPGVDPQVIRLGIEGARTLRIDPEGSLVAELFGNEFRFRKPRIYQPTRGNRQAEIEGGYVLRGKHTVGFRIASFDITQPLIIDPSLSYSTYLGGSAFDSASGIAVGAGGAVYLTGQTSSLNFPRVGGVPPNTLQGPSDAFVTKFDPTGTTLVYSTYLGGASDDAGAGIAVDSTGSAYVTGQTASADFPTTASAFSPTRPSTSTNAFLAQLDSTGATLLYATYLGGSAGDQAGLGVAVGHAPPPSPDVLAYVTGWTTSAGFPKPNAFQPFFGGGTCERPLSPCPDAFVAAIDTVQSGAASLIYSTYLGGSGADIGNGIAADSAGHAYVTGSTASANFPTVGAFQSTNGGEKDAFVAKIDTTLSGSASLVYSTYLGGNRDDFGTAIALSTNVSSPNLIYVAGQTGTPFPTSAGAFQVSPAGGTDAFVSKLDTSKTAGASLVYSTYLGGDADDAGYGIAVDSIGNAYITGITGKPNLINFPTASPLVGPSGFQGLRFQGGSWDAFVTKLNAAGSALIFSTYLGGAGDDAGFGIALDSSPAAYVAGQTTSANFPVTGTSTYQGGTDAFVSKITGVAFPVVSFSPASLAFSPQAVGTTSSAQTVTLTNNGDAPLTINSPGGISISPTSTSDFAISSNNCPTSPNSLAPGLSCTISATFAPSVAGPRTAAISVADNAPTSPQTVPLSGTGTGNPSFSVTAAPPTATVTAGSSATFTITVTPSGGFNQTVTLSCTDPAPASSCTIDNTSVTPSGSAVTATATVTTTTRTLAVPKSGPRLPRVQVPLGLFPWFGLLALVLLGTYSRFITAGRWRAWPAFALAMLSLVLSLSCGGKGDGGGGGTTTHGGTTAGDYTLSFIGTGASQSHNASVTLTVK